MRSYFRLLLLIVFLSSQGSAQVCRPRSFQGYYVVSIGFFNYYKSHLGISAEAGIAPPSSHFVFAVKSSLWTEPHKYEIHGEDKSGAGENDYTGSTMILKGYYVPQAYSPVSCKWAFGCGVGFYISEFSKSSRPSLDLSTAYLIMLKSQSCSDQRGCLRIETGALVTSQFIKPSVSLNMFLLL